MLTKYSYNNIDAIIESIHSNSEIISSMVKRSIENDKQVTYKMNSYASLKGVFSHEQMELYRGYVENKEDVENMLDSYAKEISSICEIKNMSIEICNDNSSFESIHRIFSKINSLQIKIMEMLCGIMDRANMLLSAI